MIFSFPQNVASQESSSSSLSPTSKLAVWKMQSIFDVYFSTTSLDDLLQKNEQALFVALDKEDIDEKSALGNIRSFALAQNQRLFPRKSYVGHQSGRVKLFMLPESLKKSLGSHTLGAGYEAFQCGVLVGGALVNEVHTVSHTTLFLSDGVQKIADQDPSQFVAGLLQRGMSNSVAKKKEQKKIKSRVGVSIANPATVDVWNVAVARGKDLSNAMAVTRSLVNMPPNRLTPETFEMFVRETVREFCSSQQNPGLITVDSWVGDKLLSERCELLYGVGAGSAVPPRLLKLVYHPCHADSSLKHVTLVGKGVTFDSGGLDIKGSQFMRNMKKDMGGAACAFGAFLAVVARACALKVTCYLPLAENMISGSAMRPGDVFFARNGLSVEIDNTDAEGRLILADALAVAAEDKPDVIVNLATLTGAARVALGSGIDAMFANNEILAQRAFESSQFCGDLVWRLPLFDDYVSLLDSSVADLANSSSSGHGGAITAALFLKQFVGQIPWLHIDTYMWTDKPTELYAEAGATAKCVRLLDQLVARLEKEAGPLV